MKGNEWILNGTYVSTGKTGLRTTRCKLKCPSGHPVDIAKSSVYVRSTYKCKACDETYTLSAPAVATWTLDEMYRKTGAGQDKTRCVFSCPEGHKTDVDKGTVMTTSSRKCKECGRRYLYPDIPARSDYKKVFVPEDDELTSFSVIDKKLGLKDGEAKDTYLEAVQKLREQLILKGLDLYLEI